MEQRALYHDDDSSDDYDELNQVTVVVPQKRSYSKQYEIAQDVSKSTTAKVRNILIWCTCMNYRCFY